MYTDLPLAQDVKRQVMEAGEPLEQARKEWEKESRDFTVSSGPVRPVEEPPDGDKAGNGDAAP